MNKKPIKQFLQDILPYSKYVELDNSLEVSKTKLTRLLSGKDTWSLDNVKLLLEVIQYSNSPQDLLDNTDIQTSITVHQMQQLMPYWENKLQALHVKS